MLPPKKSVVIIVKKLPLTACNGTSVRESIGGASWLICGSAISQRVSGR